jgi:hypothetical protein
LIMADAFIPDIETVRRAQAIGGDYTRSRLQIVADRPGNPMRAEIRRFGAAVALRAPAFGEHQFNRAYGFSDGAIDAAAEVIDWFGEVGAVGSFEVAPGLQTAGLTELLHARGYRHADFHATFAGPGGPAPIGVGGDRSAAGRERAGACGFLGRLPSWLEQYDLSRLHGALAQRGGLVALPWTL